MNRKIKLFVFASLVLSSLATSSSPAWARHEWRWSDYQEDRRDLRRNYRELEDARQQLQYDLRHGASRRRIARDEARIRALEDDIRADRREFSRWYGR